MKKIKDICTIVTSGQIMSRVAQEEDKKGKAMADAVIIDTANAIIPKAIANGVISNSDLIHVNLIKSVDNKKRTSVGDVIVKLSTPYDSAVVAEGQDGLIATSFCAMIKGIHPDYLPEFVCAYLNSSAVKAELKKTTAGATIPLLRVNDIKELPIPAISLDMQIKAVSAVQQIAKKKAILGDMIRQCETLEESVIMTVIEKEALENE